MSRYLLTLVLFALAASAEDRKILGEIDFFGYKGFDPEAIRSALPFHEGEGFPPAKAKSSADVKRQVSEAVRRVTGQKPTSITFACCDSKQRWMVYIGLPGASYLPRTFHYPPTGTIRLPKAAITLSNSAGNATAKANMTGHSRQDMSEGYALTDEPKAREAELKLRDYALQNEALILEVLASSKDAQHRAIAADMLGYGRQSHEQIEALVNASLDPDDSVRNNAVRALWVLGSAKPELGKTIPIDSFIRLLRSGEWSDLNKASLALMALTKTRDPEALEKIRSQALDSLLEMAHWRNPGHAAAALTILGRIAGLAEANLEEIIEAGQVEAILSQFDQPLPGIAGIYGFGIVLAHPFR